MSRNRVQHALRQAARSCRMKGSTTSGSFNAVFVGKDLVFKIAYHDDRFLNVALPVKRDYALIKKYRRNPSDRKYFPVSRLFTVNGVSVMMQRRLNVHTTFNSVIEQEAIRIAKKYKLHGDMRAHNFAVVNHDGKSIPVFIDVNIVAR